MPERTPVPERIILAFAPVVVLGLVNGLYNESLHGYSASLFWLLDATHFVVLPALALVYLHRRGPGWAALGLARPAPHAPLRRFLLQTTLVTLAYAGSYEIPAAIGWALYDWPVPAFGYGQALPAPGPGRLLGALYLAASAAFAEELAFRAAPWAYLRRRVPEHGRRLWIYTLTAGPLFGLIHWENGLPELVATTSLGVAACLLYARIENIWPFMSAHLLVDVFELG
ncbi:MAG: CPBP family intramembrane metalloprotease [Gammaproteobacteria bacterium]|nr:CPBP family intramembrane metalloprotease [Gammaproteobacteria bacterium]